jgi:hypothetical protein
VSPMAGDLYNRPILVPSEHTVVGTNVLCLELIHFSGQLA